MSTPYGLGIAVKDKKILLYSSVPKKLRPTLLLDESEDGFNFKRVKKSPKIKINGKNENIAKLSDFRFSKSGSKNLLTYKLKLGAKFSLAVAQSEDSISWEKLGNVAEINEVGMIVPDYKYKGRYVLIYGESSLKMAFSKNLKIWSDTETLIKPLRKSASLSIGTIITTSEGIQLVYYERKTAPGHVSYSIKTALYSKKDPHKLLWEPEKSIWRGAFAQKELKPIGIVNLGGRLISYWQDTEKGILAYELPPIAEVLEFKEFVPPIVLDRIHKNPILSPILKHFWESKAVFNPAAIYEAGKVHLIYRAIGDSDTSVLGYATSEDGIHIDERHTEPIYVPSEHFELANPKSPICSLAYMSGGGGGGGCEDPRIMRIKDRFYMTYVAYDGSSHPRIALTSIKDDDFLNKRFDKWEKPVLISPPGVIDKNASILPEKVKGKYVIFHRIYPHILVDYVDSLEFDGKTKWLKGQYKISPVDGAWDSRKVGIGPPPIKTKDGWLVIYQAVGDNDPGRYKMGAMLLDLEEPTHVLARSKSPILSPDEWYENEGHKAGVVYPCGAVNKDGELFIYYGAADTVVCGAKANLSQFVDQLKYSGNAHLTPINAAQA